MRFVYATSRWKFIDPENQVENYIPKFDKTIFVLWHNRLAFGPKIFLTNRKTFALVSPHSDGKLISKIVSMFGLGIIEGSSNKNPIGALKKIILNLNCGHNVIITPDGPRGPVYKVSSNLVGVAQKYNSKVVPLTVSCSKYFLLNSWDRLILPLPFNNILVLRGKEISLFNDNNEDKDISEIIKCLQATLIEMTSTADRMMDKI
ncbi:MAG: lysophospholipid acyltransferase family protein [Janthinobacterium lividum]